MQKSKKRKLFICIIVTLIVLSFNSTTLAVDVQQGMDPIAAMNNLVEFILSIVTVIGVIALIWGAVQLALALKSQDASQRTSAILFLAGGAIMVGVQVVLRTIGVAV